MKEVGFRKERRTEPRKKVLDRKRFWSDLSGSTGDGESNYLMRMFSIFPNLT